MKVLAKIAKVHKSIVSYSFCKKAPPDVPQNFQQQIKLHNTVGVY
jgi:hypothetical protein